MSERKINLEKIWQKRFPYGILPQYARDIAMELAKQILELAAENAKAIYYTDKHSSGEKCNKHEAIVDKQSILNTINQIE